MAEMNCIVVTPEKTVLQTTASFVALPLYDGQIGIARGHSPMIGRLGYGEMRLETPDGEMLYYVDGGFLQVAANQVTVLTERALTPRQISVEEAEKDLREAMAQKAHSAEAIEIRHRAVTQARAKLKIAKKI